MKPLALALLLTACSNPTAWDGEVCADLYVGPGLLDSLQAVVPADSLYVMADGTVVRVVPCATLDWTTL